MPDFSSVEEARSHFKCDWHRHNIRRKLKARPSLKEEDFETIVEQENEVKRGFGWRIGSISLFV